MAVFCDSLKLGSTAALDCRTGQNKGRYCKKEVSFLLVLLRQAKATLFSILFKHIHGEKYENLVALALTIS